jgi:hypothetical protein
MEVGKEGKPHRPFLRMDSQRRKEEGRYDGYVSFHPLLLFSPNKQI